MDPERPILLKKEPRLEAKLQAFAYQAEAVDAIRDREYAAIFHEQGLGKTKIAIDLMLYWLENQAVDTVLLVVKKTLLHNWMNELRVHTFMRPLLLTQNHSANFYALNTPSRLLLTHYEAVKSEGQRLALFLRTRRVAAILDESTKIKNPNAGLTRAFLDLAPGFTKRVIMTGTPVANRPEDIWSQICFLDLGASLGTDYEEFRQSVQLSNDLADDVPAQRDLEMGLEGVFRRISGFTVRETKQGNVISLPEKIVHRVHTEWESRQWDLYSQIRDELRAVVVRDGVPAEDNAEPLLKRLLRLVQVASNPRLIDASYTGEPGKLEYLRDLVSGVHSNGEKCIIWTSFVDNVEWLARELRGYGAVRVHGRLHIETRNRNIDRFLSDPKAEVMVATPAAAKEGLTLTVANNVIFYDRSFSLDDYLQAQDRVHRISQTRTCMVHNLIMGDSIDEWVESLLHAKHVAAQLTQGDISLAHYQSTMAYDFGDILRGVLGIQSAQGRNDDGQASLG